MATLITRHVPSVSARVAGLKPVVHGGVSHEELVRQGMNPNDLIDLSTNVNPYGPPASVAEVVARVSLDRYPDPSATAMREALARQLRVTPEQVIAGNGSIEIIYLLAQAYLDPGDKVLVLGPTFGEYSSAAGFCGAEVVELRAREQDGFKPNVSAIVASIRTHHPKLVFCCNPNNPTGQALGELAVRTIMDAASKAGGMLVLDEAYLPLADEGTFAWSSLGLLECGPVVLLRSLTKDYALPGLRLGYAVAPPEVGRVLNDLRIPWAVNAFAQEAGTNLLTEKAYLAECRAQLARDKAHLLENLSSIEARYVPSVVNYCLVRVGDQLRSAPECRTALLGHGVIVRDCTNFGLPDHIRVSVHSRRATDRLTRGLMEWQAAQQWTGGGWHRPAASA
jgi:histidinol-phosphate aminotransferase